MNRLTQAFKAFFAILSSPAAAEKVSTALNPPTVEPQPEPEPAAPVFDLRVLALLQRDGRLIDFLMESIEPYDDSQIGAAVRDIHARCQKTLVEHFKIEPIGTAEGSQMELRQGFDPALFRLTGQVSGSGPWKGRVNHAGWQATEVHIPDIPGANAEVPVIHPLELEV